MLSKNQLDAMSGRLRVYDVDQNGWEQEPKGPQANIRHVLYHLTKDQKNKDFTKEKTIKNELAPDSVQYALRLGRWSLASAELLMPTKEWDSYVEGQLPRYASLPKHQIAHILASGIIAECLHDIDHLSERRVATTKLPTSAISAAQMLLYSAQQQAEIYGFDLESMFDNRLTALRKRFEIPEPTQSVMIERE